MSTTPWNKFRGIFHLQNKPNPIDIPVEEEIDDIQKETLVPPVIRKTCHICLERFSQQSFIILPCDCKYCPDCIYNHSL